MARQRRRAGLTGPPASHGAAAPPTHRLDECFVDLQPHRGDVGVVLWQAHALRGGVGVLRLEGAVRQGRRPLQCWGLLMCGSARDRAAAGSPPASAAREPPLQRRARHHPGPLLMPGTRRCRASGSQAPRPIARRANGPGAAPHLRHYAAAKVLVHQPRTGQLGGEAVAERLLKAALVVVEPLRVWGGGWAECLGGEATAWPQSAGNKEGPQQTFTPPPKKNKIKPRKSPHGHGGQGEDRAGQTVAGASALLPRPPTSASAS
jgi:hypothetical protein